MDQQTLQRLIRMTDESESVVVPAELLKELVQRARAAQITPEYEIGDQVRVDPHHCGVVGARGFVTDVWAGNHDHETVYEVLLGHKHGSRMLYRESELLPMPEIAHAPLEEVLG